MSAWTHRFRVVPLGVSVPRQTEGLCGLRGIRLHGHGFRQRMAHKLLRQDNAMGFDIMRKPVWPYPGAVGQVPTAHPGVPDPAIEATP